MTIVMDALNDGLQSADTTAPFAKSQSDAIASGFTNSADYLIITIIMALYIGGLIVSYFLDTHPVFLIIGILFMLLMIWFGFYFANGFNSIATPGGVFGDQIQNHFTVTKHYMNYFIEVNIGFMALILIVLYFKPKRY